jgi:hypothetical protein
MEIVLTSVHVEYQDAARHFSSEVLGFTITQDYSVGEFSWLTVVTLSDPDGVELLLRPNANPIWSTYQKARFDSSISATAFGPTCRPNTNGNLINISQQVDSRNSRRRTPGWGHPTSPSVGSSGRQQFAHEGVDPAFDLVDDRPDLIDAPAGRVVERPVDRALSGIHRTGVTAAHGDNHVGQAAHLVGERLGEFLPGVETTLSKEGDDRRIELGRRLGASRVHVNTAIGLVVEQHPGGHTPSRIVRAEKQHDRPVTHGASLSFDASTRCGTTTSAA